MPKNTKYTLKSRSKNPIPTQLEVLFFKHYAQGEFRLDVVARMMQTNVPYLLMYLRCPDMFKLKDLRVLGSLLSLTNEQVLNMCLERCVDYSRLRAWAIAYCSPSVSNFDMMARKQVNPLMLRANRMYKKAEEAIKLQSGL